MIEPEDAATIKRAQEVSEAAGFAAFFEAVADDIESWWADGVPEPEVDRRIDAYFKSINLDGRGYLDEQPYLDSLTQEQKDSLAKGLRIDEWLRECAKAVARSGKPLPFIYAVGDVFTDETTLKNEDEVLVWAVATRATNPETVARKFVKVCKQTFGGQVSKDQRPRTRWPGQLTPTEAMAKADQGVSYKDIALHNLRNAYPDITLNENSKRYRAVWRTERERVVEEVKQARALWRKRLPDSSTGD